MDDLFSEQNIWKIVVLAVAGAAAFIQTLRNPRFPLFFIAGMLFFASLGITVDAADGLEPRTWLFAVQANRQILYAVCAGMVILGVAVHAGRINTRTVPGLGVGMMLLGIYMGLITIFHEGPGAGIAAATLALGSVGVMLLFLTSYLRTWDDVNALVRMFVLVGCLWSALCIVQVGIDQRALTMGYSSRRFMGLSGNPQHAAGFAAAMATVSFWVFLNNSSKRWRFLAIFCGATHAVFILWTASRTGLAMTTIGFAGVLYSRLGRGVLLAPIAAAAGFGLLTLAQAIGIEFGFERFTSTDDTRTEKWLTLLENGLANPVLGMGIEDAGGSENGFLYGFAAFGIGAPIIMGTLLLATMFACLRLIKTRFDTGSELGKRVIDLTIAYFAMYWAGNMFEGFGVARMSPQLCFFVMFACIASASKAIVEDEAVAALEEASAPADEEYPAPIRV